jgi:hypothetical protein
MIPSRLIMTIALGAHSTTRRKESSLSWEPEIVTGLVAAKSSGALPALSAFLMTGMATVETTLQAALSPQG